MSEKPQHETDTVALQVALHLQAGRAEAEQQLADAQSQLAQSREQLSQAQEQLQQAGDAQVGQLMIVTAHELCKLFITEHFGHVILPLPKAWLHRRC